MSKTEAQRKFEVKFKSKASGAWKDRDKHVRIPGKYFYLKGAYDFKEEQANDDNTKLTDVSSPPKPPECMLHPRLQELIKLVCNVADMEQQMAEVRAAIDNSPRELLK